MVSYTHRPRIRFFEVDQQRVIYHMWYLAYFEDARNEMLAAQGLSLVELQNGGADLQIVHYDLNWAAPARWQADVVITVSVARVGRSSFQLAYACSADGVAVANGHATYVVVAIDNGRSAPVPESLRRVLSAELTL